MPVSLFERSKSNREIWTIPRCIAEYLRNNSVPLSDIKLLDTFRPAVSAIDTANLNYDWAEAWICSLKRTENLSPSTILHRARNWENRLQDFELPFLTGASSKTKS